MVLQWIRDHRNLSLLITLSVVLSAAGLGYYIWKLQNEEAPPENYAPLESDESENEEEDIAYEEDM